MKDIFLEFSLFEVVPKASRPADRQGWWHSVQKGKYVSGAVVRSFRVASDLMLLSVLVLIGFTTHAPFATIAGAEVFFAGLYILLFVARLFRSFFVCFLLYLLALILAVVLNLTFPGAWGMVVIYTLCVTVFYLFPLKWSLLFESFGIFALVATYGILRFSPVPSVQFAALGSAVFSLVLAALLCQFGLIMRNQYLLVVKLNSAQGQLQDQVVQLNIMQERLQKQMVQNEELAAERERTRIARDMHDVLSHSLAVFSIQIQAARHLLARDPERVAAKLDDMAVLLRESMTESRRAIGLLRAPVPSQAAQDDLGASLRVLATTFNARTGISCRVEESGMPRELDAQQQETLHLALREMLTNAHRHGAAQKADITLQWQESSFTLIVHDDGRGQDAPHLSAKTGADEENNGDGGHHGLQGMRERVSALHGSVEAGPAETGGFTVTLCLPIKSTSEKKTVKEKMA